MVSWLDEAITGQRPFILGQLRVEPIDTGWRVTPDVADAQPAVIANDLETIRRLVQRDDSDRYRPLSGARSLPCSWSTTARDAGALRSVLEVIYPLATHHIAQQAEGTLRLVPLAAVLERQSGRYEKASTLSDTGRELATNVVCGQCVREPVWAGRAPREAQVRDQEATRLTPVGGTIPCPEPCSIMVAFCREAAQWEAAPPPGAPVDPSVGFAAFETPGNALRERWLAARAAGEVLEVEVGSGIPADTRH